MTMYNVQFLDRYTMKMKSMNECQPKGFGLAVVCAPNSIFMILMACFASPDLLKSGTHKQIKAWS